MIETYVTTVQAARLLGVDRTTIWRWVKAGQLTPAMHINGRPVFDRAYIDQKASQRTLVLAQ